MLYQLPFAASRSSLAVREDRGPLYGFSEDLREFICLRPGRRNDELGMMNVESIPVGVLRKVNTGGAGNLYAVKAPSEPRSPFLVRDRPGFDHTFIEDLREFICLRLDRVDPYRESEEYCRQQEKAFRHHERLEEMLSEEGRTALLQYDEALGAAHYLETAMLGERAFLDGMRVVLRAMREGALKNPNLLAPD